MSFQINLIAKLKRGMPADDLVDELVPEEFKEGVLKWMSDTSKKGVSVDEKASANAALCEFLSKFLCANFAPENLPATREILASVEDKECEWIKVTGFDFDDNNIPIVNVEAGFSLEFKKRWTQEELGLWEQRQDDPLAWCINVWWAFEDIDEEDWEGYLDTNDGVDLFILE